MNERVSIKLNTIDGKCENCGNNLKYSPVDCALKCEKCYAIKKIDFSANNRKLPYENVVDDDILEWQKAEKYIKCKSCGSTIELKNNEISIDCPYCNSQNIVLQKDIKGLYPTSIIRFAFDKDEASKLFHEQVKKKFLAPRNFKKAIPQNQIEGFYFPAFDFDADSFSTYNGKLYRHERRGTGNDAHTVTVYFNVSGKLDYKHRDVLVESSARLSQFELQNMLPYDFSKRADFKAEYLFGYKVEQYNEQFKVAVENGNEIMKNEIKKAILRKYTYDGVSYLNVDSKYSNKCFAYSMMPVYTFEYHYKNKKYLAYMNGQTGKLGSGLPVSKVKVAFGIILGVLLVLLPILLLLFLTD